MQGIRPFWKLGILGIIGFAANTQAWSIRFPVFKMTVGGLSGDYGIISYDGRHYDLLLAGMSVPLYDSAMTLPRLLVVVHVVALAAAIGYLIRMIWRERHPTRQDAHPKATTAGVTSRLKCRIWKNGSWMVLAFLCLVLLDILAGTTIRWVGQLRADKSTHVQVNAAGEFSLGQFPVSHALLAELLKKGAEFGSTNYPIYFHARGTNSMITLAPMVDRCRDLGFKKVNMVFEGAPNDHWEKTIEP